MKKYKRITALFLACIFSITMPVQNVWAKETSVTTSVEKSEDSVQETKNTEDCKNVQTENSKSSSAKETKTEQVEQATVTEPEQEKKERYIVSELAALKEFSALLEKQYQAEMQTTETLFLKYFVQRVYAYIEQANQMLVDY